MARTNSKRKIKPAPTGKFYLLPENDGKRLLQFFTSLSSSQTEETPLYRESQKWVFWFSGFLGCPVTIDELIEFNG